ncbi:MAG: AlpA family phage regulatory protein [Proteobacteria bacterium]|nr:AlpA family phage regulatory protein [Pseudomonadota bacterium]MCL2306800.1 AlpA family phage regulatory protein [Pseudomonadota bacterium]
MNIQLPARRETDLIRLPEVTRMTGLGKSSIYAREMKGGFPKRIKIGSRTTVWKYGEVAALCEARAAVRCEGRAA